MFRGKRKISDRQEVWSKPRVAVHTNDGFVHCSLIRWFPTITHNDVDQVCLRWYLQSSVIITTASILQLHSTFQRIDLTFGYIPGVEHWQFIEPPAPLTTRHCHPHGEDLLCSASIPSGGINAAHMSVRPTIYFTPHLQIAKNTLGNSTLGSLLALRSVNENNSWWGVNEGYIIGV